MPAIVAGHDHKLLRKGIEWALNTAREMICDPAALRLQDGDDGGGE